MDRSVGEPRKIILSRHVTRRQALKAGGLTAVGLVFSKPIIDTIKPVSAFASYGPTPQPITPIPVKNPRSDAWPKLSDADKNAIQNLINQSKKQEALDKLRDVLKSAGFSFGDVKNGQPVHDSTVRGEGVIDINDSNNLKMGDAAFSGVPYLYTSLMHEMVHIRQIKDGDWVAGKENAGEVEAYQRELDNAANTGITAAEKADAKARRDHYQSLIP